MDGVLHVSAFQDTFRRVEIPELTYRYFKETGRTGGKLLDAGLIAESPACLETASLRWPLLWPLAAPDYFGLSSLIRLLLGNSPVLCNPVIALLTAVAEIAHIQWCLQSCHLICSCYHGQSLLKGLLCGFLWPLTSC